MAKPTHNKSFEIQNLKAKLMNAERLNKKISDQLIIIKGWSVMKNIVIAALVIGLTLSLVL